MRGSISAGELGELDGTTLMLASSFLEPRTLDEAEARLAEDVGATREEIAEAIENLVSMGILREVGGHERLPAWEDCEGFSDPWVHLRMLADEVRVRAYREAIHRHARGKAVLDLGTGTGIMALFAWQAGARRVYAVEETSMAKVARAIVARNGANDRVEVIQCNSLDLEDLEPVDVIVHELFGVEPFEENLLPFLQDARDRWLRPGGRMVPQRLEVAILGIEGVVVLDPQGPPGAKIEALGLAYGVDLAPLGEDVAAYQGLTTTPHAMVKPERQMTDEATLLDIDFGDDLSVHAHRVVRRTLTATRQGRVEALVIVRRFHLDDEAVFSTSPFEAATHWGCAIKHLDRPKEVAPGDRLVVQAELRTSDGREGLALSLVD